MLNFDDWELKMHKGNEYARNQDGYAINLSNKQVYTWKDNPTADPPHVDDDVVMQLKDNLDFKN